MSKTSIILGRSGAAAGESELDMTIRHVREGKAHVERQREIIAQLERDGHEAKAAHQLLATFEHTQSLHRQHLARLMNERR